MGFRVVHPEVRLGAGDSITGLWRKPGEDRAAYPLQAAGRWCFEHPDPADDLAERRPPR